MGDVSGEVTHCHVVLFVALFNRDDFHVAEFNFNSISKGSIVQHYSNKDTFV